MKAKREVVRVAGVERVLGPDDRVRDEFLEVKLTDEETLRISRELAEQMAKRRDSELRMKAAGASAKKELAEIDAIVGQLRDKVSTGKERRYVACLLERDHARFEARTLRLDTGELVHVRPLQPHEMQASLFGDDPEDLASAPDAPVSKPAAKKPRKKAA